MWLASCLEQGRTAVASTLADAALRRRLEGLRQMGALAEVRAQAIICPMCEAHSVHVVAVDMAACRDCGPVALTEEDLQRLAPDGDWLRRRMAQALGLVGESALMIVPGKVWRLGDVGTGDGRHRVLFGQQLGDIMTLRVLQSAWPSYVGEIPVILVTTTPAERIYLPGIPVRLAPLAAAFRVRGNGLVADEAVWSGMLRSMRPITSTGARVGPFACDYRDILLPGESAPIPLTSAQSALLRVLWEQRGAAIHRESLIALAKLDLDKPVQAFPRPKYPDANRAYRTFVRSNRQGMYWWAPDAFQDVR